MKTIKAILIISIVIFACGNIFAQKEYQNLESKEGIDISYKWKHSKILKKDSPLKLILKIKNSNDYNTQVNFTIDYFWQAIRNASSEPNTICIKSNRTAKGRMKKLGFDRAEFSDEEVLSDEFTLDVSGLEIKIVDRCKK